MTANAAMDEAKRLRSPRRRVRRATADQTVWRTMVALIEHVTSCVTPLDELDYVNDHGGPIRPARYRLPKGVNT